MKTHLLPEWHLLDAVWVSPPHNPHTWPGCLDAAQQQFAYFTEQLARVVTVRDTTTLNIPTLDSWIRDYGPIFTRDSRGGLHLHDFRFNSYGGKYDSPATDDAVARQIAQLLDLPLTSHHMVLEGGSIDTNGQILLTTRSCLLNPNRNPAMNQSQIEIRLRDAFGMEEIFWLDGPLTGDDTDGHVDTLARFVSPDRIVALRGPSNHPDHRLLERNWQTLREDGRFDLVELPMPSPLPFDFPGDRFTRARRELLPAGYANFLIANGSVFVPTYRQTTDDKACRALESALPGMTVVPIPSEVLIVGQGSLHCLTMQQPAV